MALRLNPSTKRKAISSTSSTPHQKDSSAAARKRAKTYDARTLAVQSADAALSATGELNVAAYVGAHEFEIRALEAGIQRSKVALTSRAFQKVPRSLRRRTASHNVKRVPRRLRARAKREMIDDNTPTVTARRRKPTERLRLRLETVRRLQSLNAKTKAKRATSKAKRDKEARRQLSEAGSHAYEIAPRILKIKKNKLSRPPLPESKFKKRQREKTWLPTHMFHAKRAHLTPATEPLWRFAMPLTPTEKSYRPTHRAATARGAVVWDVSYMSTIQLEGTEAALESVLRAVGVDSEDAWGRKGKKWRDGTRALQAWVFKLGDEKEPIAPVTLIWCSKRRPGNVDMTDDDNNVNTKNRKPSKKLPREKIFIRLHPSVFLQLWNEVLVVSKQQNPPVLAEDLRFEIGSIDVTGPGSTEALISALHPIFLDGKEPPEGSPEAIWPSLLGVTDPSSLPANALLAFFVSDPRLHFPHQPLTPPSSDSSESDLAALLVSWPPDETQNAPSLFDRPARLSAIHRLPSQKAINRRRTLAGAGTHPSSQPSDPQIPIIALASRTQWQSGTSSAHGKWTVLLPWKCVIQLWYSIMYCPLSSGGNPRFGGLKEQQQLAFENGEPWFPGDFPGTLAGWEWGLREREERQKEWQRKPKGKRIEFDSLDLGNGHKGEIGRGWACDWEKLAGGLPDKDTVVAAATDSVAVHPDGLKEEIVSPPLGIRHLNPEAAASILNHRQGPLPTNLQSAVDKPSLATVRISLYNRGTPTPCARIYRLPTRNQELRQKWLSIALASTSSRSPPLRRPDPNDIRQVPLQQEGNKKPKQPHPFPQPEDTLVQLAETRQRIAASLIRRPLPDSCHFTSTGMMEIEDNPRLPLPLPLEDDIIGFVISGNYNLTKGRGTGIGSILVSKAITETTFRLPALGPSAVGSGTSERDRQKRQRKADEQRRICIIRSAGERVGKLGFWEVI